MLSISHHGEEATSDTCVSQPHPGATHRQDLGIHLLSLSFLEQCICLGLVCPEFLARAPEVSKTFTALCQWAPPPHNPHPEPQPQLRIQNPGSEWKPGSEPRFDYAAQSFAGCPQPGHSPCLCNVTFPGRKGLRCPFSEN